MVYLYLAPKWFVFYSLGLELVFAFVTLLVALYAYKVYRITKEEQTRLFSLGFISISLSYLIWGILNLAAITELNSTTTALELKEVSSLLSFGVYSHIVLFLLGLLIIGFNTFKIKNFRAFLLILLLGGLAVFSPGQTAKMYYVVSGLLLVFIAGHYLFEYTQRKNRGLFIMFFSFSLLFIALFELMLSVWTTVDYVIAHMLVLASYLLILANLLLTLKHGKKKNKA